MYMFNNNLTYFELQDKILWELYELIKVTFINSNFDLDRLGEQIVDSVFSKSQLKMIYEGLLNKLDISLYAFPNYDFLKMHEILLWLQSNLDIQEYLSKIFPWSSYL